MATVLWVGPVPSAPGGIHDRLATLGHRLVLVDDRDQARAYLREGTIDLIIADLEVWNAPTAATTGSADGARPAVPIIIVADPDATGWSTVPDVTAYLPTPIRNDVLEIVLQRSLEAASMGRENDRLRREIAELQRQDGARAAIEPEPTGYNLKELTNRTIQQALTATGGNRTRAAKLLGISERTLRYKLNTPKPTPLP